MGQPEKTLINQVLRELPPERRLFRINAGRGWVGDRVPRKRPDILILKNPRVLQAAPKGWLDLCGWTTQEITPDMVGQKFARFTFVEVKATGSLTTDQKKFRDIILRMGGVFEEVE